MEGTDQKIRSTAKNKQKSKDRILQITKAALYRDSWVNVSIGTTSYSPDDRNCNVHSICSSQTTLH